MHTLHLTTSLPYPAASGGAIRVHGIIEGLRRVGHEVALLCFHDGDTQHVPDYICTTTVPIPYRTKYDRLKTLLFTHHPDIATRFYSEAFAEQLRSLLQETTYDLVQFEGIETVCYLPLVKKIQPTAKLCFDTFNAEYALQRLIYRVDRGTLKRLPATLYSWIQARRIEQFEGMMCRLADMVIAVSPEDADLLKGFRPDQVIHTIPNGIWVEEYEQQAESLNLGQHALVFTGKMDYRPNVDAMLWFADAIFPQIMERVLGAQLYIVGQQPHPRLDRLRSQPNIHMTGWVDSVLPYLQAAALYVAPLRMGSGTRLKLLGAMAAECPIVATTTASAGLLSEVKEGMIIADTPEMFAESVIVLLGDAPRRMTLSAGAKQAVRIHYDWSALIPRLLDAYRSIGLDA